MRRMMNWLGMVVAVTGLVTAINTATVFADEDDEQGLEQRVQRLEGQIHQLAEQRDQMQRPGGPECERRGPPPRFESECQPPAGPCGDAPREQSCGPRSCHHHRLCGLLCWLGLCIVICNILLAVWIFTDIRKRGEGSGLFIVLALLIGIPAAVVYALVRIGDRKA